MSTAYDGDIPSLTGTHYGGDGIGIVGSLIPTSGVYGASIISRAVTVVSAQEYRLFGVSLPAGFSVDEDGSGQATASLVATFKLFVDGVEV
jgi:hypothetical protein